MKFYNEPGSITHRGVLYLSFDASPTRSGLGNWSERKIILIASKDHGLSWKYIGALTTNADATAFGYVTFTGSSLVKVKGKIYLFITPAGARGPFKRNRGHNGTYIVPFKNIIRAVLQRELSGKLKVTKSLKPGKANGGLSDYHEMITQGGILFSQIYLKSSPKVFQIYSTGINIRN